MIRLDLPIGRIPILPEVMDRTSKETWIGLIGQRSTFLTWSKVNMFDRIKGPTMLTSPRTGPLGRPLDWPNMAQVGPSGANRPKEASRLPRSGWLVGEGLQPALNRLSHAQWLPSVVPINRGCLVDEKRESSLELVSFLRGKQT